jgi:hypothetical protein
MAKRWVQIKNFEQTYVSICSYKYCRADKIDNTFQVCEKHKDLYWKYFDPEYPWDFEKNPPVLGSWMQPNES